MKYQNCVKTLHTVLLKTMLINNFSLSTSKTFYILQIKSVLTLILKQRLYILNK
jgi:hypothetical protein